MTDADVVIWGLTTSGRMFRPGDWADRLAGLTSAFGTDQKLSYSPYVQPMTVRGVRALIVGHQLAKLTPRLHQFLLNFARDNDLAVDRVADAFADVVSLQPPGAPAGEPHEPV